MTADAKKHLVTAGLCSGTIVTIVTWFLTPNATTLNNLWGLLNFPVFALAALFHLPESFGYPLVFIQWFIIGSGAALLKFALSKRKGRS